MNYDVEMNKIIKSLDYKPKLLLHSCCAPCSTTCIERIKDYFDITIIYYNPNIEPLEEYEKRKKEQIRIIRHYNIKYLDCDYDNDIYHKKVLGYESEPEKGLRCHICYRMRLEYTALKAKEKEYDYFGTTLTVSPYKLSKVINEIGLNIENMYGIKFLVSDFKKNDGYKKSIELSKEYNLYRQDYCGCIYSRKSDVNE